MLSSFFGAVWFCLVPYSELICFVLRTLLNNTLIYFCHGFFEKSSSWWLQWHMFFLMFFLLFCPTSYVLFSFFLLFIFSRLIDWFASLLLIKTYLTREQWVIWNDWIVCNISGQLKWICFSSVNRSKCKYSVAHAHQHNNLLVFVLLNKISRNTNVLCQFKSRERDFFCWKKTMHD